jgi:hypothetical protein
MAGGLTNDQIIEMVKAGKSDTEIIGIIHEEGLAFSPDGATQTAIRNAGGDLALTASISQYSSHSAVSQARTGGASKIGTLEVGLLIDKQFGTSQSVSADVSGFGVESLSVNAVNPQGFGIRGAVTLAEFSSGTFGLSGTWRPKSTTSVNGSVMGMGFKYADYKYGYGALGLQVDWNLPAELHLGAEFRRESLTGEMTSQFGGGSHDTTYNRPWISAGIGKAFPHPTATPFVRFEAAVALQDGSSLSSSQTLDDVNKSLAPHYQLDLYGGLRF